MNDQNAQTPWEERFVVYRDVTVQYFIQGAGPSIVFLPSHARHAEDFFEVGSMIAKQDFRCICVQPRWIGKSTGPNDANMHDLAMDVISVIEKENAAPVLMVGHAYGNWASRVTAKDRPDLVKAVCVAAAAAKGPARHLHEKVVKCGDYSLPDEERLSCLQDIFFAPSHDPSVWLTGWTPSASELQVKAASRTPQEEWWSAGGTVPFFEIRAEMDPFAPPERAHEMREMFGDRVTTVEIPNASHGLFPEQTEAVTAAIVTYARLLFAK